MTVLCRLQGVSRVYVKGGREIAALREVSFEIASGEAIAIMGPSGSGKSSLLNLLGLLDRPTSGTYHHLDRDVSRLDDDELSHLRNRTIGFVFQSFNLFPQLDVLDNVEVPMIYAGVPAGERRRRGRDLIERVGLQHRATHRPGELSGGEMQRVAIARALANEPSILLADEPTGNLDEAHGRQIMQILSELNVRGMALVVVTHNPEIALHARRTLHLRDGRLV
jgi:putative ABC transport system ATP-binding protein